MTEFKVVSLEKSDYYCGFLQLLEQLTVVNSNEISYDDFARQIDKMKSHVVVIKKDDGSIVGTAAVLIEEKFIHKLSSVGHIEDVVVDKNYREKGLGKLLVNYCIEYAKSNGCYKIILNCSKDNMDFYKKCGFTNKNFEMSLYI